MYFIGFRETVTLLVDIPPEDRLFLKHDAKPEINSIVNSKGCKVDLNLPSSLSAVIDSCQVSISGPPNGVRDSYLEIRQLLPITIWFDLKLNPNLPSIVLDPNAEPLQAIQKKYEIAIYVVPIQPSTIQPTPNNHISIYIRTNRRNEDKLKAGIEELAKFIKTNNYGNIYSTIQTKIDVPSNQPTIIGRTYSMLDPISTKTTTQISVQKSAPNHMLNVLITGLNYSSISIARTEISDRFVVELNYNVSGHQSRVVENCCRQLERMSEEFGVHILMRPDANPANKTMIIRGTDKEVTKIFEVREHILQLIKKPPTVSAIPTARGTAFVNS